MLSFALDFWATLALASLRIQEGLGAINYIYFRHQARSIYSWTQIQISFVSYRAYLGQLMELAKLEVFVICRRRDQFANCGSSSSFAGQHTFSAVRLARPRKLVRILQLVYTPLRFVSRSGEPSSQTVDVSGRLCIRANLLVFSSMMIHRICYAVVPFANFVWQRGSINIIDFVMRSNASSMPHLDSKVAEDGSFDASNLCSGSGKSTSLELSSAKFY